MPCPWRWLGARSIVFIVTCSVREIGHHKSWNFLEVVQVRIVHMCRFTFTVTIVYPDKFAYVVFALHIDFKVCTLAQPRIYEGIAS